MPDAPASRHALEFSRVIPPKASTGIVVRQAWRRVSSPVGFDAGASFFSKIGPKTAKVAAFAAALLTSSGE